MTIPNRLKEARIAAGFRSAREAADSFGWTGSTYAAHENGTRGIKPSDIEKYARAFRSDPCLIAFGQTTTKSTIAGVPESVLREVIRFVMSHDGAKSASKDDIADLIVDLCHYVRKSGEAGLENIVDFELARRAAQAG
ncbi:helix-turn-helix transcriptional regulator [Shimia thalassica]|uniref:helix-turn-helix domain-containing protein n=1 Tax=Shimia thalassica TaxID=1715693 RepID=UPI002090B222|nr:helix-turn-helix transcriptional regulator [Shimia thalassica]MDO6485814.1 helix-turn-helix transcriptional regulator [Shimia thalassica]MDO6505025.1 helix-turn-helix transcriptional regulator [Shimia thalassica]